jgi:predicted transcriptional regulator
MLKIKEVLVKKGPKAKEKKGKTKEMEIARKGNSWKNATACVGVF